MIAVTSNDVLCGRGGATNNHSGNRKFRKLVASHQEVYLNAKKRDKKTIANLIVERIKQDGGRFLKREEVGGVQSWVEVPSKKACEKTSQALREGLEVRRAQAAKEQQLRMANGNTAVGAPTTVVVGEPGKQHLIPQPPQVPNSSSHHLAAQHPNNMMYAHSHQPHHAHVQHYSSHPGSSAGGSTYTPHFTQQGQAPPGSVHSNIYHNMLGNPNGNNSSKAPNLPPQSLPPPHHHHQMNIPVKNNENVAPAVPPQGAEPGIPQSNSNNKFLPPQTNKNGPSRNNPNSAPPAASSSTKLKQEEFKQEQQQGKEKVDGYTKKKEETSTNELPSKFTQV